jgi:hypothetical protein
MPLDSMFKDVLNHRIDGILGYDIFNESVIKFDFDNKQFQVCDSLTELEKETYSKIEYERRYRKPIIKTELHTNNSNSFKCTLIFDMGSGRGISLTHKKGKSEKLFKPDMYCEKDSISGMGGTSESCYITANYLVIDNLKIDIDTIEIGRDQNGALGLHDMYDGLVGMEVIKKYNLLIYNSKNRIWLKKRN